MPGFARPCLVCGRRVEGGAPRCPAHENQRYSSPVGCYVCGRPGPKGYCPDHDPTVNEQARDRAQPYRAGYRMPEYRQAKKQVLKRAGGRCEKCGRGDLALEVDHIVPLSAAQSTDELRALNDVSNLIVLCLTCHRHKPKARR